ncbi:hypothetical protein [Jannaschia sp. LMIT008]|nr:hypothetical protein [Jannaschia sp. LMIT008]
MKAILTLPLIAMIAACVPSGNNRVDTPQEIEATTDQDVDGDLITDDVR